MDLPAYFDRVGFKGSARADLATLRGLHRAHLQAIPYENFDVQLGRPLTLEPGAAFEKIVEGRRGGWCYEMNGLFGSVLTELGFKVTQMAGAAMRDTVGDGAIGNHLLLLVEIDGEPWIADVGFGDGSLEPFRLQPGAMTAGGYAFHLEQAANDWWRFHNHEQGGARSFDFRVCAADPALLAAKSQELQTAADSIFVLNALAQRYCGDTILQLRGRVLRRVTPPGIVETELLGSADALVEALARDFDLDLPEAASLWPRICARHRAVMAVSRASG